MIQPAGTRRDAVDRPALQGGRERLLDRFLGDVDVTEDADQDGHGAPVLGAEGMFDVDGHP